jgi:hypothetical protein
MLDRILAMLKRIPGFGEILPTFAFIAFLVYGRMLYIFAWKLPSWLMNLTMGEIFSVLSYSLVFAVLECLGLTLILLVICFVLPAKWFRDDFIVRSTWLMTVWLVSMMIYFARMSSLGLELGLTVVDYIYPWIFVTLGMAALAGFASTRVRFMRTVAAWFADRTIIFLFIFLPASLVGLIVMVFRNIG